jgi:hypothetical protein
MSKVTGWLFNVGLPAVLLCLTAMPVAAQNLVKNGTFVVNTGVSDSIMSNFAEVSNWYTSNQYAYAYLPGGGGPYFGPAIGYKFGLWTNDGVTTWDGSAPGGTNYAMMFTGLSAALNQNITGLTVGTSYKLSFSWALSETVYNYSDETGYLSASLGGTTFNTSTASILAGGFSGWMNQSFYFVAGSPAETLGFSAYGSNSKGNASLLITGVSLQDATEPTSLMLLCGAFGVLLVVRRSHRYRRSVS